MPKVYEVIVRVTGGTSIYIEADSAEEANDIALNADLDINIIDLVDGYEILDCDEDDDVDPEWVDEDTIIRKEG